MHAAGLIYTNWQLGRRPQDTHTNTHTHTHTYTHTPHKHTHTMPYTHTHTHAHIHTHTCPGEKEKSAQPCRRTERTLMSSEDGDTAIHY